MWIKKRVLRFNFVHKTVELIAIHWFITRFKLILVSDLLIELFSGSSLWTMLLKRIKITFYWQHKHKLSPTHTDDIDFEQILTLRHNSIQCVCGWNWNRFLVSLFWIFIALLCIHYKSSDYIDHKFQWIEGCKGNVENKRKINVLRTNDTNTDLNFICYKFFPLAPSNNSFQKFGLEFFFTIINQLEFFTHWKLFCFHELFEGVYWIFTDICQNFFVMK